MPRMKRLRGIVSRCAGKNDSGEWVFKIVSDDGVDWVIAQRPNIFPKRQHVAIAVNV